MVIDAVLVALAGAFCFALAAVLQHHEAEQATAPSYAEALLTSSQERGRLGRASREIAQTHDETNTLRQFEDLYAGLRHRSPTTHRLIEAAR